MLLRFTASFQNEDGKRNNAIEPSCVSELLSLIFGVICCALHAVWVRVCRTSVTQLRSPTQLDLFLPVGTLARDKVIRSSC